MGIVLMIRRIAAGLLLTVAIVACSVPGSVKPGDTQDAVRSAAGRPTAVVALPDGGVRWQYSGQPYDQSVWNINMNAQGRVVSVEQMMSDEAFARIRSGKDTRADVLREFGQPAETFSFPMMDETAFMYRYFIHGGFYAAMFVYFDPQGVVKRTETGMDPWRIRDGGDRR
jgi:outer membrane protein assembly factor BamE (lipoprotein component of BamABCDE complex)